MEKKEAKKEKPKLPEKIQPQKEYFSVTVEALAPVHLHYRIYAESPEEAVQIALKQAGQNQYSRPNIIYGKMKAFKATIYNAGTSIIRLVKNM